jgi:hypothetical protein
MKHKLPIRPLSDEVWHASRSMEDSERFGFDKGGKTHNFHKYLEVFIMGHCLLNHHGCMECSHRLNVWNFCIIYVFLDNNFIIKESNKGNHLNL